MATPFVCPAPCSPISTQCRYALPLARPSVQNVVMPLCPAPCSPISTECRYALPLARHQYTISKHCFKNVSTNCYAIIIAILQDSIGLTLVHFIYFSQHVSDHNTDDIMRSGTIFPTHSPRWPNMVRISSWTSFLRSSAATCVVLCRVSTVSWRYSLDRSMQQSLLATPRPLSWPSCHDISNRQVVVSSIGNFLCRMAMGYPGAKYSVYSKSDLTVTDT